MNAFNAFNLNIAAMLSVKLDYFHSSSRLLGALSAHTDPEHPLSPFSERTRECRERDMQVFAQAGQRKTQALLDKSLTIAVRLIKISGLPPMRPQRRVVVDLVETVTG